MSNNKGFTLVELIASIALILLISVFVMPRLVNLGDGSKEKIYNSKINMALSAAYRYGKDNIDMLSSDDCVNITIGGLISLDYMDGDDKTGYYLVDPLGEGNMNNVMICVTYSDGDVRTAISR